LAVDDGRPSWAAVHPYYERPCRDPTRLPDCFDDCLARRLPRPPRAGD
jgi:hypothetical protein